MEKIRVHLAKRLDDSYDIVIGKDLFPLIAEGLSHMKLGKVVVITDTKVKKLYGQKFLLQLKKNGVDAFLVSFPAGEKSKTRQTKERIEDYLFSAGIGRDGLIIALGGGVVGDVAGFTAATYMRGIHYLQIPTTLLAMVDSSIGGKTGLDTMQGKNLIGCFYQPKRVFVDVKTLSTLPKNELINGLVEMVKHAIIIDHNYFVFLEDYLDRLLDKQEELLIKAIKWSCMIKKHIIERDETEKGLRKSLNFGHTVGHAIELASKYELSHGEAVALGIIAETKISKAMKIINQIEAEKIINMIGKLGIHGTLGSLEIDKIISNMKLDKKNTDGKVNYTLVKKIGEVVIDQAVSEHTVRCVLGEMK